MIEKLKKVLEEDDGFVTKVRFLDGYDEEKLYELLRVLKDLANEWKGKDYIPKVAVNLLIDVIPALISSSYSYEGEEREKINFAIDDISEAIRTCLS
mgnify:CR=1 FL=1